MVTEPRLSLWMLSASSRLEWLRPTPTPTHPARLSVGSSLTHIPGVALVFIFLKTQFCRCSLLRAPQYPSNEALCGLRKPETDFCCLQPKAPNFAVSISKKLKLKQ